jgi:hypothetical protein
VKSGTYQELGLRILVVLMRGVSALSDSVFCFCAAASLYESSVALKGNTERTTIFSALKPQSLHGCARYLMQRAGTSERLSQAGVF